MTPHWAEHAARQALENLGWVTLEAGARFRAGELDLVMQEGETLVFVEVRQRRAGVRAAAESITETKRRRVRHAAARWLAANNAVDAQVRFDAVLVEGGVQAPRLRLVRDAF